MQLPAAHSETRSAPRTGASEEGYGKPRPTRMCVALGRSAIERRFFGAGALLYLMDADKGAELSCVASVSGGSLTNAAAFAAATCGRPMPRRSASVSGR